uniref:Putative DNA replication initiation protein n=1 Tax=viral metagenome TaxID=1070528 RepID=A0A6M3Y8Q3_9ZZZZ
MANPQKENGYTPIANEIMDAFSRHRIPGEQRQILDCIIRKTYGYNKKKDTISFSQFEAKTGLKKPNISRSIKALLSKKIISVIKSDNGKTYIYEFNKDFEKWVPLSKMITLSKVITTVIKSDNESLSKVITTKDNKDTLTKDKEIYMSDDISNRGCPHQKIIDLYHGILCPPLPKVMILTPSRKKVLRARWNESDKTQNLEWWEMFFGRVKKDRWVMGENDRGWTASLDWILTPKKFIEKREKYKI